MQEIMDANASRHHGKAPNEIEWSKPELRTFAARGISLAAQGN
jgi:hypothetical protein